MNIKCETIKKSQNQEDLLNKINELQTTIMELEYKLNLEKEEKTKEIEDKSKILCNLKNENKFATDQLKLKLENSFSAIEELTYQRNNFSKLLTIENEKNKILENEINEINLKNDEIIERIKNSEIQYIKENCLLQQKLTETKESLNHELCQNNAREIMINGLSEKLNSIKNNEISLQKHLEIMTKQFTDSEQQRLSLQNSLENNVCVKEYFISPEPNQETAEILEETAEILEETPEILEEAPKLNNDLNETTINQTQYTVLEEQALFQDNEIKCLLQEVEAKDKKISELCEKIQQLEEKNTNLNNENQENSQECSELKQRILSLIKKNEIFEREITELKCKSITARKLEKIRLDDIDFSLENYLCEQGIENLFVKLSYGTYLYGCTKVNISLTIDNRLICKAGGGYIPIHQFLKLYQQAENEDISKSISKQPLLSPREASPRGQNKRASSSISENSPKRIFPKENATDRNPEIRLIDKSRLLYPLRERNFTPLSRLNKHK